MPLCTCLDSNINVGHFQYEKGKERNKNTEDRASLVAQWLRICLPKIGRASCRERV